LPFSPTESRATSAFNPSFYIPVPLLPYSLSVNIKPNASLVQATMCAMMQFVGAVIMYAVQ
jgi:hypothetical protein